MSDLSRTVTFSEPTATVEAARTSTGLATMEAIRTGRLPAPAMSVLLGFRLVEVSEGRAVFACTPGPHLANPMGGVHGGLAMTMLDSCTGAAVHTTLPIGWGYGTVQIDVHLVRAIRVDGPELRASGVVLHRGSTLATATGELRDADGALYAHASATCMLLPPRA